jgi:Arc/MetJ family transcription regulator
MKMVKKTIELDQEAINRIKAALDVETEKEAVNFVLRRFDTDLQLAEATLNLAGKCDIKRDIDFEGEPF